MGAQLHDPQSVIYVFPKFIGHGGVLAVRPATFDPPGDFPADIAVQISVRDNQPREEAQYIRRVSERRLNSGRDQLNPRRAE
jgi:hypothetical protein